VRCCEEELFAEYNELDSHGKERITAVIQRFFRIPSFLARYGPYRYKVLLALILLLGGWLRFAGLTRGVSDFALPEQRAAGQEQAFYQFHPDEETLVQAASRAVDPFQPPFTAYGMLPLYLLRGVLKAGSWVLGWNVEDFAPRDPRLYLAARTVAALLSCAVLALTWGLGAHCFGQWAALGGIWVVALAPGAVQQAHFFIVDGLFAALSVAGLWAVLLAVERGRRGWYAAAGILTGALGGVRYNGLLLGLVLLAGHVAAGKGDRLRRLWSGELYLAGGLAVVVLLALHPFLLAEPGLLQRAQDNADFALSLRFARGEVLQPWTLVDVHTIPYWDHWFELWPWIAGWPLTLAFISALVHVLWQRPPAGLMLLVWCGLYFALLGALPVKAVRHLVPLLPFMALLVGAWCTWLWKAGGLAKGRWLLRALPVLLMGHGMAYGLAFGRIYLQEDSRIQAARWIAAHVPEGSRIGLETGAFGVYFLISEKVYEHRGLDIAGLFYGAPYMSCDVQVEYLRERVGEMDYMVVVDVNRAVQFRAVPELFPAVADFYGKLFSGELGFELAQRFKVYPEFLGMRFADDGAEPSFLGYDHPAVLVFSSRGKERVEEAFSAWQQAMEDNPHCPDVQLKGLVSLLETGELEQAQVQVRQIEEKYPYAKLVHLLEMEIHRRMGSAAAAAAAFERFRPENATGLMAHVRNTRMGHFIPGDAARSLARLGLAELALALLRQGARERQAHAPGTALPMAKSYISAAKEFLRHGQVEHMEEALRLSLRIHAHQVAYNVLATAAYQRDEVERAAALWEQSLSLDADQAEIHATLGKVALQKLGDHRRALYHLKRAGELDGNLREELGKWVEAAQGLEEGH
jgi:tetratricopeptide (TPR) repeat protein